MSDFFGEPPRNSDPRGLVNEAIDNFKSLILSLENHLH